MQETRSDAESGDGQHPRSHPHLQLHGRGLSNVTKHSLLPGSLRRTLSAPIDGASLAAFRILFGLLLAFAMIRFLANGWVEELYVRPTFYFSYEFFPWAKPLPAVAMHV